MPDSALPLSSGTPTSGKLVTRRGLGVPTPLRMASATALVLLLPCLGATVTPLPIRKLARTEAAALERKLDRRLLPPGSDQLEFQPDQSVALAGSPTIKLMPVRYKSPNPGGGTAPHFQCGLFLTAPQGTPTFLATFGTGWTAAESCDGLNAIGLVNPAPPDLTPHPDVLLIYQAYTLPESFPEPVLLIWDVPTSSYRTDAGQSQWLSQQKDGHTIPGARRLLASHVRGRPTT